MLVSDSLILCPVNQACTQPQTSTPSPRPPHPAPDLHTQPSSPFLPVYQTHGLEAGAILDLSWDWLWPLDAALGHVEGNVHTGGDGSRQQANGKLPQELQTRVLAGEGTVERKRHQHRDISRERNVNRELSTERERERSTERETSTERERHQQRERDFNNERREIGTGSTAPQSGGKGT